MISPFIQKLLVVVVTMGLLVYLGIGLLNKTSDIDTVPDLSETETASQDILSLVDTMRKMSIDSSIFSSPLFTSLVDFSVTITPELKGRPNPFAPIGNDQGVSQTVTVGNSVKPKTTP